MKKHTASTTTPTSSTFDVADGAVPVPAWRVSSLAVASPNITPALETFRVRGDLSQHDHVEGLPIGTRGGIAIRHYFPVDGEYVISPGSMVKRSTSSVASSFHTTSRSDGRTTGKTRNLRRSHRGTSELPAADTGRRRNGAFPSADARRRDRHRDVEFLKKSSATTLELLQPFERERIDPITPVAAPSSTK